MDTKDREELAWRRRAIRLTLKGLRPREILPQIPRRRTGLFTWQSRFEQGGWEGLKNQSRCPRHSPHAYNRQARAVVLRVRRALANRHVGLVGARAVQQELCQHHLLKLVPALATINRWLHAAGLLKAVPPVPPVVYYPAPSWAPDMVLQALDWTARYLTGGTKVFAFHTVDAETHALHQTLSLDKTVPTLFQHVLDAWRTLGLPHGLQLDNDAAFSGGESPPRRFGTFVRLCLYLGIELIFTPPHEPKRNRLVEGINGLWAKSFWRRNHFCSFSEVIRQSPQFIQWYAHSYAPKALAGLTPAQAHRRVQRHRLTPQQGRALPSELPLTAGRLHFIRRVTADGAIRFLGERWKVGKRSAHHYVWATVITQYQRLEIHHKRSERAALRLVKVFPYTISEPIHPLRPEYQR
jgi:hypothetical protein